MQTADTISIAGVKNITFFHLCGGSKLLPNCWKSDCSRINVDNDGWRKPELVLIPSPLAEVSENSESNTVEIELVHSLNEEQIPFFGNYNFRFSCSGVSAFIETAGWHRSGSALNAMKKASRHFLFRVLVYLNNPTFDTHFGSGKSTSISRRFTRIRSGHPPITGQIIFPPPPRQNPAENICWDLENIKTPSKIFWEIWKILKPWAKNAREAREKNWGFFGVLQGEIAQNGPKTVKKWTAKFGEIWEILKPLFEKFEKFGKY